MKSTSQETEQAGNSHVIDGNEKAKKLKHAHKVLSKKQERESASSRKIAKTKAEWRKVRAMEESSESCCLSSDSSTGDDQAPVPGRLSDDEASAKDSVSNKNHQDNKGKHGKSKKWMPKPSEDVLASEPSSTEGSENEEEKEYIYTQVCRRINQLTMELDKLRQALPACEAFMQQYQKKKHQAEVMSANTAVIKDDQVPAIQVDCKVKKHWKPVHGVVIDGGAGVNIMAKHTRRSLGITEMKEAPF